jgi:hypothetical protein
MLSKRQEFYNYFGTYTEKQAPLLYSSSYNISFLGLEKLHPFGTYTVPNVLTVRFLQIPKRCQLPPRRRTRPQVQSHCATKQTYTRTPSRSSHRKVYNFFGKAERCRKGNRGNLGLKMSFSIAGSYCGIISALVSAVEST